MTICVSNRIRRVVALRVAAAKECDDFSKYCHPGPAGTPPESSAAVCYCKRKF
ncbi:MAG: hypothetical protein ACPG4X_07735 [Pikeienuella sp.]